MAQSITEEAELLTRKRARVMPVLAVLLISQQAVYFNELGSRGAQNFKIGAWLVLALILLAGLATGGAWFSRRDVRELIDDETTREHRGRAYAAGFWAAMGGAILLYVVDMFELVSGRDAIHIIMTAGIGAALLTFGKLERRALRDA